MKTILLGMTEDQHDKRSWRCSGMVAAFILLSLALNASIRGQAVLIRQAYSDTSENVLFLFTWAVVFGQILAVMILIVAETPHGYWPDKEAIMIIIFAHAGGIFLHDYLLSVGNAHGFLSVAYLQPVLALITVWIVTSSTSIIARPYTWVGMAVINIGCIFVSIKLSTVTNSDRTSWICLLSAFTMILRNIVIRQLVNNEHVVVRPRRKIMIFGLVIVVCIVLLAIKITSKNWLVPSLCALITCALCAALTYVTTQVLKSYSVPFVSLFCVWATLVEAVMLMPNDHRPNFVIFLLSSGLIIIGHYLFIKDHIESTTDGTTPALTTVHPPKPVSTHEQYTRIEFLLFAALVMGVTVFVLQPKISQRDLNTLSYIGLDTVIRRLLLLEVAEDVHVVEEQSQVQLP
ncbi:unnamed protein product [Candidula unifasciata]|uniref:Uncharacterized protein n=1 Tax=Candidula unifasciata TaxID=100452 RepID=A0A8S3YU05_9EUPU|nr:unnamed protein product [Candidula unifasciata]